MNNFGCVFDIVKMLENVDENKVECFVFSVDR